MTRRYGHSLVECLVAIALITATLGTVVAAMQKMFRSAGQTRTGAQVHIELDRFATQFRGDAHRSVAFDHDAENMVLKGIDGRTVRYTIEAARIDRVMMQDETVEHRDSYRLAPRGSLRWQVQTDGRKPVASLMLEPADSSAYQVARIDAVVGLLRKPQGGN